MRMRGGRETVDTAERDGYHLLIKLVRETPDG